MTKNEQEVIDSTIDTDTTVNDEDIEINLDEEDNVDELKKTIETLKAQKDHWKTKANKPEKPVEKVESKSDLSIKDAIALVNAKVHEDDLSEVEDYAKFKKISIQEALKSSTVKTLLAEKEAMRTTANVTNTGTARKSSTKIADDVLYSKALKGEMPESDDDMKRLIDFRRRNK